MSTVKSSSADLTLNAEGAGNDVIIQGNGTNTATVTAEGLMQFNSGYGSVATAYGCRAWVNFNGSGTVAIRDSKNVSSITDNGASNYTINFTTSMPDVNYSACISGSSVTGTNGAWVGSVELYALTTDTLQVRQGSVTGNPTIVCASIFR
jgi:hypothetical protein